MKFIILCGGIGKRCNRYSLPKPLNMIQGRHMIEYVIENIPSNEVYIIYNIFLNDYHFREIITNKFKTKTIHFSCVDYLTRGAVESAYVGIQSFEFIENENIVFIDNDNLHTFHDLYVKDSLETTIRSFSHDFIGYSINYSNPNYSFIKIVGNTIVQIEEKNKISDQYCCGFYGFQDHNRFKHYAKKLIDANNKTKNEFYFSQLYKWMIEENRQIEPFFIEKTNHIGSYDEIVNNRELVAKKTLRICFDLDNTLVTYPTVPNDYSTVKPIHKNIQLLKQLKNDGHEIIIYTARRMATHQGNLGKVIKDIAAVTIHTLETYDIHYDELIFGKPIADIYIDDRAINPYINHISFFGLFYKDDEFIPNKMENNKYNKITRTQDSIVKTGPYDILKGELFYYQHIPSCFSDYFPKLTDFNKRDDLLELKMEYVQGIPLFYLYKNQLLTKRHIDELFSILDQFHSFEGPITIQPEQIKNNYFLKLKRRFNTTDYPFENATHVFDEILDGLEANYSPKVAPMIHGDFWFSNILLTYDDTYKFIDMRGQVDNMLTMNGDIYYDYGKLYQSILGYDLWLHDVKVDPSYIEEMKTYFLEKCRYLGLNIEYLTYVTKGLIFGTIYFISDMDSKGKQNIWEMIQNDL